MSPEVVFTLVMCFALSLILAGGTWGVARPVSIVLFILAAFFGVPVFIYWLELVLS